MPKTRLEAYAMLTHHALNELWRDSKFNPFGQGCCPKHCASCVALKFFDSEGTLELILRNWDEYTDGTKIYDNPDHAPSWWVDGKVNREWMYEQWREPNGCYCNA